MKLHSQLLYSAPSEIVTLSRVKAPIIGDRKWVRIPLISTRLRSLLTVRSMAACAIFAAAPVIANTTGQRISRLEHQMQEARTTTVFGNTGAKTITATPDIGCHVPFISIEMLYWKPFIGGSEFAYNTFSMNTPYIGHIDQMNSDWEFGFRAGLGYRFTDIDWTLGSEFTRLKFHDLAHPHGSISASNLPALFFESSAKAKWKVSFNVLDLYLSRPYFLRPRFSAEPGIGLRTAWIFQRDYAQYFDLESGFNTMLKNVNSSAGIGILGRTRLNWHWSRQWSLFGGASASLIYAKMTVAAKAINNPDFETLLDISADIYKVLPNIGFNTGLQWIKSWARVALSLAAGYDFQYWWRQNQRLQLKSNETYSWDRYGEDLGFQGFTLKAALDF